MRVSEVGAQRARAPSACAGPLWLLPAQQGATVTQCYCTHAACTIASTVKATCVPGARMVAASLGLGSAGKPESLVGATNAGDTGGSDASTLVKQKQAQVADSALKEENGTGRQTANQTRTFSAAALQARSRQGW